MDFKIGRAGNGTKTHIVHEFIRSSDNLLIQSIYCGAQQFNGSGAGHLNNVKPLDLTKVNCKRCLKTYSK